MVQNIFCQVNIDELENPIVIPQKSTKALTTKLIEVKPYKWIEIIDDGKRQIEQELFKNSLSGALTKNSPILQESNSLKSHLYKLWSDVVWSVLTKFLEGERQN